MLLNLQLFLGFDLSNSKLADFQERSCPLLVYTKSKIAIMKDVKIGKNRKMTSRVLDSIAFEKHTLDKVRALQILVIFMNKR